MKQILFILTAIAWLSGTANAQTKAHFGLMSDRDVYISGNTALVKIRLPQSEQSSIAYVDLATLAGKHVTGITTSVSNREASTFIDIPDSLSSAAYLLRVFVNTMDNKVFTAREIMVVNRFDKLNGLTDLQAVAPTEAFNPSSEKIEITGVPKTAATEASFHGELLLQPELLDEIDGQLLLCVSEVVPGIRFNQFPVTFKSTNKGVLEEKGIVLHGNVVDAATSQPVAGATVYLTIPDTIPYFQYFKTTPNGEFFFLLNNHYAKIPLVVQCVSNDIGQSLKISLDDKFGFTAEIPRLENIELPEGLASYIDKSSDIALLDKLFEFQPVQIDLPPADSVGQYPYYGKPTKIVDPDLFYDLEDFNEISKEILPEVKFRNHINPTIRVLNSPFREYFNEQPLLLLDGIPIRDVNTIADMGSRDIERVDFLLAERFFGDLRFPGVVAIYSKDNDRSNLREDNSLLIEEIQGLQPAITLHRRMHANAHLPDTRQTLLWEPGLAPAAQIPFSFTTSEIKGTFRVLVSGRKKSGEPIEYEQFFEVK